MATLVIVCLALMKSKERILYDHVYKLIADLFHKFDVKFDSISLLTDCEPALYLSFEMIFSSFCPVSHYLCKKHYTSAILRNLRRLGSTSWITISSIHHNRHFDKFYNQVKLLVLIPKSLIIPLLEFLIRKLLDVFFPAEPFTEYLRAKLTPDYVSRMSYYSLIINSTRYVAQTSNSSESGNSILNRYLASLSRSRKLNSIIRNSRSFFISQFRSSELQFEKKQSSYKPSNRALENYSRAFNFVKTITNTGLTPTSRTLKLIARCMETDKFYGPGNLNT